MEKMWESDKNKNKSEETDEVKLDESKNREVNKAKKKKIKKTRRAKTDSRFSADDQNGNWLNYFRMHWRIWKWTLSRHIVQSAKNTQPIFSLIVSPSGLSKRKTICISEKWFFTVFCSILNFAFHFFAAYRMLFLSFRLLLLRQSGFFFFWQPKWNDFIEANGIFEIEMPKWMTAFCDSVVDFPFFSFFNSQEGEYRHFERCDACNM